HLVARLVRAVPVDLLAAPAGQLAALREPQWELPEHVDGLGPLDAMLGWGA
ncbi:MAG: AAA family ATPase, partial [Catenulispora sp.]|nr:AAA family ATPase [Catenulispora sp.]